MLDSGILTNGPHARKFQRLGRPRLRQGYRPSLASLLLGREYKVSQQGLVFNAFDITAILKNSIKLLEMISMIFLEKID
jgi:hypothetical protein